ncbi:MAG TPA: RidA family protein [Dehalococcoidales bacterium]|nr:RidA family protein [Dehalococcoidales bacterium]
MEKEIIKTPTLARAYAPYSPGCIVKKFGSLIFISGVVPNDVDGNIVCKGDIAGQVRQVLHNLRVTVEAAGATFDDVIKLTTFVTANAMKDYVGSAACEEYLTSFPTPCESLVGVASLANEGQLIEVEGIFGI